MDGVPYRGRGREQRRGGKREGVGNTYSVHNIRKPGFLELRRADWGGLSWVELSS